MSSTGSTPSAPPPPLPQMKRKKSAFAIGLAKLVPSALKKSSSSSASSRHEQSLVPSSSSLSSLIPQYYTLPRPLPSTSQTARRPLPRRQTTAAAQQAPPPFVRPAGFRVGGATRTFSDSQVLTGTTPWVRGVDGYVTSTGPPRRAGMGGEERPLPALPSGATRGIPVCGRWVSESAPVPGPTGGRLRVISASEVVDDAARKVEIGRLTPWEDSKAGAGGEAAGLMEVVDLSETVVWEVASERGVVEVESWSRSRGTSEEGSVRGMVVYGSEDGEDAFVYSHHLAPSSTASTSFDLSPWTFPSHSSLTHPISTLNTRPRSLSSSHHSPTSSLSRYSLAHSSYAGSGYAVSASFSSQMRERSSSGPGGENEEEEDEEEELKTPQMGMQHLVPEPGDAKEKEEGVGSQPVGWSA